MADDNILRLKVGNYGPTVSPLTKLTFSGLDQLTIGDISPSKGEMLSPNEWLVGALWRGEEAEIEFEVLDSPQGTVTITATVSGRNPDADETNNTIEVEWTGSTPPDTTNFRITLDGDIRVTLDGNTRIRR